MELQIADIDLEPLFYEYDAFYKHSRAIRDDISNTLEGINETLVFHAKEFTDEERGQLQELSDKLEAIYDGLDAVIAW